MQKRFDHSFLTNALHSEQERVALWGTLQLMLQELTSEDVRSLLQSPFPLIQEVGLAQMVDLGLGELLSDVVGIFKESEAQVKYAAALCLSEFPNDFSKNLLHRWFDLVSADSHATRLELESATHALLKIDPQGGFEKVLSSLGESLENIIQSSVFFQYLLPAAKTQEDLNRLLHIYFDLRERYSDTDATNQLLLEFSSIEIANWLESSVKSSYSLKSIYEQCYRLLGKEIDSNLQAIWKSLGETAVEYEQAIRLSPKNVKLFLKQLEGWVNRLIKEEENPKLIKKLWLIQAFQAHHEEFLDSIPKIIELEVNLLLTIPLSMALESSFTKWIQKPQKFSSTIANYYHSPLLTEDYCVELLRLFFPKLPEYTQADLIISKPIKDFRAEMSRPEVLWAVFKGDLFGYEVDWPSMFPNPYAFDNLPTLLLEIYLENFDYYITNSDPVTIDYALQVFQNFQDDRINNIATKHFDFLIGHHTQMFCQLLEYHPDLSHLPALLERFFEGEQSLATVISFISTLFRQESPIEVTEALEKGDMNDNPKRSLRLHCPACKRSFPYHVEAIFLDMGCLQRGATLKSDSLWVEEKFYCKKCDNQLPLKVDALQLLELAQQARVESLLNLKQNSHPSPLGHRIVLIDFPRFEGRFYNPSDFKDLVIEKAQNLNSPPPEMIHLWMKLAKLYHVMGYLEQMVYALDQFTPSHSQTVEWNYLLGYGRLKLGDVAAARPNFELLTKDFHNMTVDTPEYQYIEKARYWLKNLDSYSLKRARFQIHGKKK